MRIVGGTHRGRPIAAPQGGDTRPTSDRVREALFNMLLHSPRLKREDGRSRLGTGIVLDAFAGSGALGFEALSRGAAHAYFFESDAAARRAVLQNAAELGLADRVTLRGNDACQPGTAPAAADLVFLDPPYQLALGREALEAFERHGWLKPDVLIVIESDGRKGQRDKAADVPPGFTIIDERSQGPAWLTFVARQ